MAPVRCCHSVARLIVQVVSAIARNPDQGSLAAIYAAASPDVDAKGLQGVYLDDPGHEVRHADDEGAPLTD